jgi:thiol:disulfide interchange protein DsbA
MTTRNEHEFNELEKQLSSLSLVEPSATYGEIINQLKNNKPNPWWKNWPVSAGGIVFSLVIVSLLVFDNSSLINPQPDTSIETSEAVTPVIASQASQQNTSYIEGTHYIELPVPVEMESPDTNELVVFFWYPCDPCHQFNDHLQQWEAVNDPSITVTQIPAIWSDSMQRHARAYYTAETLGVLELAHNRLYAAAQGDKDALNDQLVLSRLFGAVGVSATEFREAYNSRVTLDRVAQAEQANRNYQVQGTPALFVNGRYMIAPVAGVGFAEMLKVAEYLMNLF